MEADLIVAAGDDVHQGRVFGDIGDGFLPASLGRAGFSGDENIEIADSLAAAAEGSGGSNLVNTGKLFHVGRDLFALDLGRINQEASANPPVILNRLEQL